MVVFVAGLPGTGKTWFAKKLATKINGVHINSDSVRNEMSKMGRYDPEDKQQVYEEMKKRMVSAVSSGKNVVVDATFYLRSLRQEFIHEVEKITPNVYWILVNAAQEVVRKRVERKREDSEADFKVYQKIRSQFEHLETTYLELWTDRLNEDELLFRALKYIHYK